MDHHADPPRSHVIEIEGLMTYLAQPHLQGSVDVVEIFGGESGVGKLCIRRRLRRGDNVDLVAGFDLTQEGNQMIVEQYIKEYRPLVIVL